MVELRLLGEIDLRGSDGRALEGLLRLPKRLALLAYLASPEPGTWHRRDMLLALFWPEADAPHARTALRNALHVLRQHLGDRVIRTRGDEEVSIDPTELRTDAATVWEALRSGRPEVALSGYGGDLLPGLYPPDGDGFLRWVDAERLRIRTAVTAAATARAEALQHQGETAAALRLARRVLEIHPNDEIEVRRVMSMHDLIGDRAGALATFEAYRRRLNAEFGADPAPETLALASRLREPAADVAPGHRPKPRWRVAVASPDEASPGSDDGPGQPAGSSARPRASALLVAGMALIASVFAIRAAMPSVGPQSIGAAAPLTSIEELEVQAAISPNGRLIAYAHGTTRQLRIVVQRIDAAEPWSLTSDTGAVEQMPRWAPDNDRILFLSRGHAWVAPSLGGTPRIVARGTGGEGAIRSAAWSPGGDSVAVVRNDSVLVLPIRGSGTRYVGRGRQIHSCEWGGLGNWIACVSGNWVAFEPGPLFGNRGQSAIVLFPSSGGAPIDLTGSGHQHHGPAWSADGRFLWFLSDREGVPGDVFAVAVGRNGRATGPFVRVGLTAESISLARDRIAYSLPFRRSNVWSVPVPDAGIAALSDVGQRITSGTQLIEVINVSFDRKWLVYDSNVSGQADIFRVALAGGQAERLVDDPRPEYCGVLSPDGRELAWHRWSDGIRRLFVKRLDDDATDSIPDFGHDQGTPQWSPDGQSIAAWSHDNEEGAILVARRDATGRWVREWRLEGGQLPTWSLDGRSLAFVRYDGAIETISADSGMRHRVYAPRAGSADPVATYVYWKLDPSTIWFLGTEPSGRGGIWSVPAQGGAARLRVRLDDPAGRTHGPSFTSDGSRFFLTLDERFSNVWWAELKPR
jgi:Tol biopolymer transport system component/DNA-binding SARP family transcriptional activator